MKKYFAKYLPVIGEIKEGDKVLYTEGELGFPPGVYDVLDNVKEGMSVKSVGGFGIYWLKNEFKDEKGKTRTEGAYLKIGYNINPKNIQKVKLFLCSRDIIWENGEDNHILITNEKNLWGQVEDGSIIPIDVGHAYDNDSIVPLKDGLQAEKESIFKVIGEISPEATWVKEGDEFEENEVKKVYLWRWRDDWKEVKRKAVNIRTNIEQEVRPYAPSFNPKKWLVLNPITEDTTIQIKGPCGHFH